MRRRICSGVALFFAALLAVMPAAFAGGEPQAPDQQVDLDAVRDEIPPGFPGKFDLTEGEAQFLEYVALYGQTADTTDFGSGSKLTGTCGGYAYSYDSDGQLIDAAIDFGTDAPPVDMLDGGQAFTSGNRFKVDTNGLVNYFGFYPSTGDGPENHTWSVKTGGISIDKGGDPNPKLKNRAVGVVDLAEQLPVKFNANVKIEGSMTSSLGICAGNGHVEFIATGISPLQIGSIAALLGGIFGLLFNARPARTF